VAWDDDLENGVGRHGRIYKIGILHRARSEKLPVLHVETRSKTDYKPPSPFTARADAAILDGPPIRLSTWDGSYLCSLPRSSVGDASHCVVGLRVGRGKHSGFQKTWGRRAGRAETKTEASDGLNVPSGPGPVFPPCSHGGSKSPYAKDEILVSSVASSRGAAFHSRFDIRSYDYLRLCPAAKKGGVADSRRRTTVSDFTIPSHPPFPSKWLVNHGEKSKTETVRESASTAKIPDARSICNTQKTAMKNLAGAAGEKYLAAWAWGVSDGGSKLWVGIVGLRALVATPGKPTESMVWPGLTLETRLALIFRGGGRLAT